MRYVSLKSIIILPNRQRKDFNEKYIRELADGIHARNLRHPISLRPDAVTLIAGECRMRALALLHSEGKVVNYNGSPIPKDTIPSVLSTELTELELEEAELEENVLRKDLTWIEKAEALARLHRLRTKQAEGRGERQTFQATASEVAGKPVHDNSVRNALLIDEHRNIPEVKNAKSEKEAFNAVKKHLTEKFTKALADNYRAAKIETPHQVHNADLLEGFLDTVPDSSIDCILTDPPYGINAHKMNTTDGGESANKHTYNDSPENAHAVMTEIITQSVRICKPDAALYMFCDFSKFEWICGTLMKYGWTVWPRPLIWFKPAGGMMGDTLHGPRRSYETIVFAYRGNKRTTGVYLDVIPMQAVDTGINSAAKPAKLYADLAKRSCVPGMVILDPCGGSGPILPAATSLNLRAIYVERDKANADFALTRVNEKLD